MRFGLLGYYPEYEHKDMETIVFSSDKTILEYDVLLVDLKNIFSEYKAYSEYNGLPRITDHDSMRLKKDLDRRKDELKEFLESGKSVIVLDGNDDCVYCYSGNKTTSGTGKNTIVTYLVEDVHSISLLPIKISSINLTGKSINFKNKKIGELLKKYTNYFEYRTIYENIEKENILMTIKDTKKVVSYYERIGNGLLIFLPDLCFNRVDYKKESSLEKKYYNDLTKLNEIFLENKFDLPLYSKKYMLPNEEIMINDIEKNKIKLNKLIEEIENKEKVLLELQKEKVLFTGSGTSLEKNSVKQFKEIGFSIEKYDPDSVDEDIVIKYKEKIAVVEVKGVSGSATEKHTSQIIKWKSEYHIENDILPKGILLVNAFNERILEERQEYFPTQMLKYAAHQEICLLTTIQLYNIKEYIKNNPNEKERIINEIFSTSGLYKGFEDWKLNIKKKVDLDD